jgi:ribonuclease Z
MIDNLPLKSLVHGGLTIEGYSRAAVQTYWRVPELKLGFDMGGSPWSFTGTQTFLFSHAHLDHMLALPGYVSRRRMMKMEPPLIIVPEEIVENVEKMLRAWQRLDRGYMHYQMVGMSPGQEYELSRDHVVTAFATEHRVPSRGYVIWERRRKLRPEYHGLTSDQIRDLRLSGKEVSAEVRTPLVCYCGDTAPGGLDAEPAVYQSKILITEMTFYRPEHRKDKIHKFGHTHLDDILARAGRFQNEKIILSHFSTRYHVEQVLRAVERKLPSALKGRVELWG